MSTDDFEAAKERMRLAKVEMMELAETEEEAKEIDELWPFQDHEEVD